MARTMRAVVLPAFGDYTKATVSEIPVPQPKAGEVLIKVESSVINPADLYYMLGYHGTDDPSPIVPGMEGSGTVVESGEGELGASLVGKRVSIAGKGLWAEYKIAPASSCVPLLDTVDFDQAATLWANPVTVLLFRDIIREGKHKAVIQNAANSSLGKMLIRLLRLEGVPLINIVRSAERVEALRNEGAEHVLDSSDPGFPTALKKLATELEATVAFDAVAGESTGKLLAGLNPGGVVYIYGGLSLQPSSGITFTDILLQNKRIEGRILPFMLERKSREEQQELYLEVQRLKDTVFLSSYAGHYALEQVQEALGSYAANMSAGKLLIHPGRH